MTQRPEPIFAPTVLDDTGQVIVGSRSEDRIEATLPGHNSAYQTAGIGPLGWNQGRPDGTRQVGWTLRRQGVTLANHAFSINPQGIDRTDTSRNQMFATQAGFYVDDFGEGAVTIQLNQLVAHGRATAGGGGSLQRATMREDVLRFYDSIYIPARRARGALTVLFHDSHLWNQPSGKTFERVYFPPNAVQLIRSVNQHNVWQLQITMVTLDAPAGQQYQAGQIPGRPNIRVYVVRRGDTLKKIAARLAGRGATHKRVLQIEHAIIALTRKYGADDIAKKRTVNTYHPNGTQAGQIHVNRLTVAVGEKIVLPGG